MNILITFAIYSEDPKAIKGFNLLPIHFRHSFYHTFMRVKGQITITLETTLLMRRHRMRVKVWSVLPSPIKSARMQPSIFFPFCPVRHSYMKLTPYTWCYLNWGKTKASIFNPLGNSFAISFSTLWRLGFFTFGFLTGGSVTWSFIKTFPVRKDSRGTYWSTWTV